MKKLFIISTLFFGGLCLTAGNVEKYILVKAERFSDSTCIYRFEFRDEPIDVYYPYKPNTEGKELYKIDTCGVYQLNDIIFLTDIKK